MPHNNRLLFSSNKIDRATKFRSSEKKIKSLFLQQNSQHVLIWHGKVLFNCETNARRLVTLNNEQAKTYITNNHSTEPVFLGFDEKRPTFLHDISAWQNPLSKNGTLNSLSDITSNPNTQFPKNWLFCELRDMLTFLTFRDAEISIISKGIAEWHKSNSFCSKCGMKLEKILTGWELGCTACKVKHFPRTDPVVIVLVEHKGKILLGRSAVWPEGMYSCLAGFMEPGESIEVAAAREVYEESNVKITDINYIASQPWPFPASLMIACQAKAINNDLKIDKTELENAKWFSKKEVALAIESRESKWKPAREGSIARFIINLWLENKR